MGVPIKSNNTQQGCNPISSNCVIWQGPDIPCIKMCTGDSISDVQAKLATELCEITSELDISLLDLSCFNPLYPTPQSFRDVMQIILDKICALENGTVDDGKTNTSGCPQDCEVQIAACLQYQDNLGNNVTTLPLKDYVILIGNKICTILSDITNLQNQIDDLDVRVDALENGSSGSGSSFNVSSGCVTSGSVPLDQYIPLLDAAFCSLQTGVGTSQDYTDLALAAQCVKQGDTNFTNGQSMLALQNWIASPANLTEQVQNLWVAICDLRSGLASTISQLDICCQPDAACPTNFPVPTYQAVAAANRELQIKFSPSYSGWTPISWNGNITCLGAAAITEVISFNQPFTQGSWQTLRVVNDAQAFSFSYTVTSATITWRNDSTQQECQAQHGTITFDGIRACPSQSNASLSSTSSTITLSFANYPALTANGSTLTFTVQGPAGVNKTYSNGQISNTWTGLSPNTTYTLSLDTSSVAQGGNSVGGNVCGLVTWTTSTTSGAQQP
jgi:hypothetical protein